jgi:diadenosine tetraphosphate (Ap4A) HIT family hydrolase
MKDCIFCNLEPSRIEDRNEFFVAIKDLYPVTEGHTLIIPNRHVESFFELTRDEEIAMLDMLSSQKEELSQLDNTITGFNVGINDGEDAGQTIMHCHIHLIPRRKGDMESPRGGVRGVIPSKQSY